MPIRTQAQQACKHNVLPKVTEPLTHGSVLYVHLTVTQANVAYSWLSTESLRSLMQTATGQPLAASLFGHQVYLNHHISLVGLDRCK